jgi:hypothetical protein
MRLSWKLWGGLAFGLGLWTGVAAAAQDEDWPCEQVLQPQLSLGALWNGPDPTDAGMDWQNDEPVHSLIERIAPRRIPVDEAKREIRQFTAGVEGDKSKKLTELFAGLFETINDERGQIIRGIKQYHTRQAALARRIEDTTRILDGLDPESKDESIVAKRAEVQNQLDWDARIFDDRQRLLPAVCQQPILLEQRLYTLSQTILDDLKKVDAKP